MRKHTIICAATGNNPYSVQTLGREQTHEEAMKCLLWGQKNWKTFALPGYWSVDAIKKFVARRNLISPSAAYYDKLNNRRQVQL